MAHSTLKPKPTLQDLQKYVALVAVQRGFDKETAQDGLTMLVEEVGELAKAIRKHSGVKVATDSVDTEVRHEAADVLWMLISICNTLGVDLEEALRDKEEHNKSRSWE